MNNALLAIENVSLEIESPMDTSPILRDKIVNLTSIIEAFDKINESSYWKVLKNEVFDGVLASLQSRLNREKNDDERIRLQGQIAWAEKYCDLSKLAEIYRKELINITKILNEKSN